MDLQKHLDFFNPLEHTNAIHLIGCGAIGSNTAAQLIRLGFKSLVLYDFDIVTPHNITNQLYRHKDLDKPKTEALKEQLLEINPDAHIFIVKDGWKPKTRLDYIVILALDSIELRKQIVEENQENNDIIALLDMRIGLSESQAYFADWSKKEDRKRILSTMQFTDKEAREHTPVSACGTTLSVLPTVQAIVSYGIMNIINFLKTKEYNYQITTDTIQGRTFSMR